MTLPIETKLGTSRRHELCGETPRNGLPLEQLYEITIRYFFYYEEDRGIGGHFHDVEALELRVKAKPDRKDSKNCHYALHS